MAENFLQEFGEPLPLPSEAPTPATDKSTEEQRKAVIDELKRQDRENDKQIWAEFKKTTNLQTMYPGLELPDEMILPEDRATLVSDASELTWKTPTGKEKRHYRDGAMGYAVSLLSPAAKDFFGINKFANLKGARDRVEDRFWNEWSAFAEKKKREWYQSRTTQEQEILNRAVFGNNDTVEDVPYEGVFATGTTTTGKRDTIWSQVNALPSGDPAARAFAAGVVDSVTLHTADTRDPITDDWFKREHQNQYLGGSVLGEIVNFVGVGKVLQAARVPTGLAKIGQMANSSFTPARAAGQVFAYSGLPTYTLQRATGISRAIPNMRLAAADAASVTGKQGLIDAAVMTNTVGLTEGLRNTAKFYADQVSADEAVSVQEYKKGMPGPLRSFVEGYANGVGISVTNAPASRFIRFGGNAMFAGALQLYNISTGRQDEFDAKQFVTDGVLGFAIGEVQQGLFDPHYYSKKEMQWMGDKITAAETAVGRKVPDQMKPYIMAQVKMAEQYAKQGPRGKTWTDLDTENVIKNAVAIYSKPNVAQTILSTRYAEVIPASEAEATPAQVRDPLDMIGRTYQWSAQDRQAAASVPGITVDPAVLVEFNKSRGYNLRPTSEETVTKGSVTGKPVGVEVEARPFTDPAVWKKMSLQDKILAFAKEHEPISYEDMIDRLDLVLLERYGLPYDTLAKTKPMDPDADRLPSMTVDDIDPALKVVYEGNRQKVIDALGKMSAKEFAKADFSDAKVQARQDWYVAAFENLMARPLESWAVATDNPVRTAKGFLANAKRQQGFKEKVTRETETDLPDDDWFNTRSMVAHQETPPTPEAFRKSPVFAVLAKTAKRAAETGNDRVLNKTLQLALDLKSPAQIEGLLKRAGVKKFKAAESAELFAEMRKLPGDGYDAIIRLPRHTVQGAARIQQRAAKWASEKTLNINSAWQRVSAANNGAVVIDLGPAPLAARGVAHNRIERAVAIENRRPVDGDIVLKVDESGRIVLFNHNMNAEQFQAAVSRVKDVVSVDVQDHLDPLRSFAIIEPDGGVITTFRPSISVVGDISAISTAGRDAAVLSSLVDGGRSLLPRDLADLDMTALAIDTRSPDVVSALASMKAAMPWNTARPADVYAFLRSNPQAKQALIDGLKVIREQSIILPRTDTMQTTEAVMSPIKADDVVVEVMGREAEGGVDYGASFQMFGSGIIRKRVAEQQAAEAMAAKTMPTVSRGISKVGSMLRSTVDWFTYRTNVNAPLEKSEEGRRALQAIYEIAGTKRQLESPLSTEMVFKPARPLLEKMTTKQRDALRAFGGDIFELERFTIIDKDGKPIITPDKLREPINTRKSFTEASLTSMCNDTTRLIHNGDDIIGRISEYSDDPLVYSKLLVRHFGIDPGDLITYIRDAHGKLYQPLDAMYWKNSAWGDIGPNDRTSLLRSNVDKALYDRFKEQLKRRGITKDAWDEVKYEDKQKAYKELITGLEATQGENVYTERLTQMVDFLTADYSQIGYSTHIVLGDRTNVEIFQSRMTRFLEGKGDTGSDALDPVMRDLIGRKHPTKKSLRDAGYNVKNDLFQEQFGAVQEVLKRNKLYETARGMKQSYSEDMMAYWERWKEKFKQDPAAATEGLYQHFEPFFTDHSGYIYIPSGKELVTLRTRKKTLSEIAEPNDAQRSALEDVTAELHQLEVMSGIWSGQGFIRFAAGYAGRGKKPSDVAKIEEKLTTTMGRAVRSFLQKVGEDHLSDGFIAMNGRELREDLAPEPMGDKSPTSYDISWLGKYLTDKIPHTKMDAPTVTGWDGIFFQTDLHRAVSQYVLADMRTSWDPNTKFGRVALAAYDKANVALKIMALVKPTVMLFNNLPMMYKGGGLSSWNLKRAWKVWAERNNPDSEFGKIYWQWDKANLFSSSVEVQHWIGNGMVGYVNEIETNPLFRPFRKYAELTAGKGIWGHITGTVKVFYGVNSDVTWGLDAICRISMAEGMKARYMRYGRSEQDATRIAARWTNDFLVQCDRVPHATRKLLNRILMFPTYRIGTLRSEMESWKEALDSLSRTAAGRVLRGVPVLRRAMSGDLSVAAREGVPTYDLAAPVVRGLGLKYATKAAFMFFMGYGFSSLYDFMVGYRGKKEELTSSPLGSKIGFTSMSGPLFDIDKIIVRPFKQTAQYNLAGLPGLGLTLLTGRNKISGQLISRPGDSPAEAAGKFGLDLLRTYFPFGADMPFLDPDAVNDLSMAQQIMNFSGLAYFYNTVSPEQLERDLSAVMNQNLDASQRRKAWYDFRRGLDKASQALMQRDYEYLVEELTERGEPLPRRLQGR